MTEPLYFVAGTDFSLTITAKDGSGSVIDITGASIEWQLKRKVTSSAVLTKTTASGITLTDAENGVFKVSIADTDTEDLSGEYLNEAKITLASGSVIRLRLQEQQLPSRLFFQKLLVT